MLFIQLPVSFRFVFFFFLPELGLPVLIIVLKFALAFVLLSYLLPLAKVGSYNNMIQYF